MRTDLPVLSMRWEDVAFLHWRVSPDDVQRQLPSGLTVDTFAGDAWVGLVPFRMTAIRLFGGFPVPFGTFPEVNVRTYVRGPDGKRGVWFHSLDVDSLPPTLVARSLWGLPYNAARVRVSRRRGEVGCVSLREGAEVRTVVTPGRWDRLPDALTMFLTDRDRLFTFRAGGLWAADVLHAPWKLRHAESVEVRQHAVQAAGYGLSKAEPDHVRYSAGVEVRVLGLRRVPA